TYLFLNYIKTYSNSIYSSFSIVNTVGSIIISPSSSNDTSPKIPSNPSKFNKASLISSLSSDPASLIASPIICTASYACAANWSGPIPYSSVYLSTNVLTASSSFSANHGVATTNPFAASPAILAISGELNPLLPTTGTSIPIFLAWSKITAPSLYKADAR